MLSLILAITLYSMPVTKVTRHDDVQSVGRRRKKYMNSIVYKTYLMFYCTFSHRRII